MAERTSLAVVLCLCAATLGARQTAPSSQQPTFGADTQAVRVDVYPTRDGQPVHDLRRDEIQLFEDGVPQAVQTFERIVLAPPGSEATSRPRTIAESRQMAADPRLRVTVAFLDTRHSSYIDPQVQQRFPVFAQVQQLLGADDLIALMTPDMRPADLAFDRGVEALARLEGTFKTSTLNPDPDRSRDPKHDLYAACYPRLPGSPLGEMIARYEEQKTLDALEALVAYLGQLRDERTAVLLMTEGWRLFTENPKLVEQGGSRFLDPPTGGGPRLPPSPIGGRGRDNVGVITSRGDVTLSDATFRECEADLLSLSMVNHVDRLREITVAATRSNVGFYPISTRGLGTSTAVPGASTVVTTFANVTEFERHSTLRALAEDTGGLAIVNTNNIDGNLGRVMADTSAFYLVGYTSTNGKRDSTYRRITVRVTRPGVDVRARPGYFAAGRLESAAPARPREEDPIRVALSRLESDIRQAADGATNVSVTHARLDPVDQARLFRGGPAARAPYVTTADPRFRRSERLRVELESTLSGPATARLLDRRGAPLPIPAAVTERPDPPGAFRSIIVDVTLAPLAIGDYLLEIVQGDARRLTAFRVVP